MTRSRVLCVGLGPIGLGAADLVRHRPGLELAGAVDVDPEKSGRDLSELLRLPAPLGVRIDASLAEALARVRPDVVVLCTAARLAEVAGDVRQALRAGADVISSCEELVFPGLGHPDLAHEIDREAQAAGATVLGTGVNPGFVLDFLPVVLSGACREVERVWCRRVVDAASRRLPLQRKVGAGLAPAEFRARLAAGELGHVGLRESVALVGRGVGLELTSIHDTVEPVIAAEWRKTPFLEVARGAVAGIQHVARGRRGDEVVVELELEMYVGAPDPGDEVVVEGSPGLRLRLVGGVPGDEATAAILVNSIAGVVAAAPGLKSVLDLPPPRRG